MTRVVVRLAGVVQPVTRVFQQETVTIGTATDCDIVIEAGETGLPVDQRMISLRRRDGVYRVEAVSAGIEVTRSGETIAVGEIIQDGDTFFFGATGVRVRFFTLTGEMTSDLTADDAPITEKLALGNAVLARAATSRPVLSEARSRRLIPRTDVAIVFIKQLVRELFAEIPRRVLYAILGIVAFLVLTFLYFNTLSLLVTRSNSKAIEEMKQTLGETRQEIDKIREELRQARDESATVRSSLALPENVARDYGHGVCVVYGTYVFVDPRAGREVRFKEQVGSDNPIGQNGELNLTPDGNGRLYEVEFIGTGFLARQGLILTNRHVVHAWEEDDLAALIRTRGYRPRLKDLFAYFPKVQQPFPLKLIEATPTHDVALCSFDQGENQLPILPLEENPEAVIIGQQVVLIGYPSGLEGLVARFTDRGRSTTRNFGNQSFRSQLDDLSGNSRIRPQASQGYITDVSPQLTYDARTDEGGSGGPVFGSSGRVIGINQAILLNSQATTTFGVPIRYGIDLLKKYAGAE